MPSRVIRGDINSSRSLARVSRDARLTFRSLLNVVDDFGRFDGRISLLRSLLYPVDPNVTDEMVEGWLHELTLEMPTPPVLFYWVDGAEYLHLPGWEKHRGNQKRRKASGYPDPPPVCSSASKPPPRISGNPPDETAGVGVGVGVGLGEGVGEGVRRAASPPPPPDSVRNFPNVSCNSDEGETPNPAGKDVHTSSVQNVRSSSVQNPAGENESAEDAGAQKRGHDPADAGGPVAPVSRRKREPARKTQCPEELAPGQWGDVLLWRNKNRPAFRDAFLREQWKAFVDYHVGEGNIRANWPRSFYTWLRRDFCKPPPAPPRVQPPVHIPSDERPPDLSDEQKAAMHAEHLEGKAKRRRRNPPIEEK